MNQLKICISKDMKEFVRGFKNIICLMILLCIASFVLGVTLTFPSLIEELSTRAPEMISDSSSLKGMMQKLFPTDLKGNLGIFASDVGVFYTIVIALICYNIIPSEIGMGKWVVPLNCGIKKKNLIVSKCLVYSVGVGLPVFVVYNLYALVASFLIHFNCSYNTVFMNSIVLAFALASVASIVILSSLLYKHSIFAAISMIVIIMTAPDVLTFFVFGNFFPTYLLTFTYRVEDDISSLIVPVVALIIIIVILYIVAVRKVKNIELTR